MSTIPQTDTHLTFASIDAHVRAEAAALSSQTQTTAQALTTQTLTTQTGPAAPDKESAVDRLIARYGTIRPILVALEAIPLIPPAWRAGLTAFTTAADEVVLFAATPLTTDPAPVPVNPDFKAGKDQ